MICLSNMENINAVLIEDGLGQKERLIKLNKILRTPIDFCNPTVPITTEMVECIDSARKCVD